jgi:hypothetical protein
MAGFDSGLRLGTGPREGFAAGSSGRERQWWWRVRRRPAVRGI